MEEGKAGAGGGGPLSDVIGALVGRLNDPEPEAQGSADVEYEKARLRLRDLPEVIDPEEGVALLSAGQCPLQLAAGLVVHASGRFVVARPEWERVSPTLRELLAAVSLMGRVLEGED